MLLGEAVTASARAAAARTGTARAQRAVRSALAVAVLASWASRCAEGAPAHDMALFAAAMKNNPDKIEAALRAGANVDAVNLDMEKNTALIMASVHGRGNSVVALLKAGADTALTDNNGIDAINAAAFHGQWGVVNLLVKHNVDPDVPAQDGWTPLFRACWGMEAHHTDTVNILLRAGVDFQKRRNGKLAVSMVKHKPTFDLLKKYKDAADGKTVGAVEQTQAKAASGGGGSTDPLYGESRHDL